MNGPTLRGAPPGPVPRRTKRALAPEAIELLEELAEGESVSHLALRARSTPTTLEMAIAGQPLMERTCARLEKFLARAATPQCPSLGSEATS